jgi:hypothetical protein
MFTKVVVETVHVGGSKKNVNKCEMIGLQFNRYFSFSEKGCVALCIYNMQRVQELSPLEIVEMFVTVFCFLKDSSEVSQVLLDDFRACQGYIFLSEFLLR